MAQPKLPKTIFVKLEEEGTEDEYLSAFKKPEDALDQFDVTYLGEYQLVAVRKGKLNPHFE